ncbi:unnamed protein product [Gongylonema pulchrum]|uniref:Uncharacterized protein n=1 Tax=Gongylonema pulchrum TaxID=637853 RepID=A0A183DAV9_9BILA|nr:unnamed protein product [Gongylonema pulchrum]
MPQGVSEWDWTSMSENNFAELCVFHVPDKPLEHQDPSNRAATSLPLNLTIRSSQEVPKVASFAFICFFLLSHFLITHHFF